MTLLTEYTPSRAAASAGDLPCLPRTPKTAAGWEHGKACVGVGRNAGRAVARALVRSAGAVVAARALAQVTVVSAPALWLAHRCREHGVEVVWRETRRRSQRTIRVTITPRGRRCCDRYHGAEPIVTAVTGRASRVTVTASTRGWY